LRFVPTFLAVFLGAQYAQGFLNSFPKAVLDIMSVLGGMLPALGIALLLSAIMPNVNKLLFFLIGFVLIAALPINLLVLTVIGCFIAYMYYLVNSNKDFEEENSMEFEGGISEGSNNNTYKNKLTKRELNKVFWRWIFMIQSAMNSERLQGSMFGYALLPIFKKYYKTEEEIVQALKPHNSFFDTENQLGAVIPGVVAGLEEAKGNGKPITNELVASIKTSLMGGITGVAATLVMGVIMPLLLSISISLADGGNIIGPIFYTVTWFPLILLSSYFLFKKGYTSGSEAVAFLTGKKAKKITEAMTILGIIAMGGLAASNVNMSVTAVYQTAANSIVFQDLINSVFPKLLPLIITLFSWKMLLSKKVKALGMLGIYIIIAIVGVLLGIL
jgi:mannose/fructose/N-acetylgalactosamine-specific phosphotransferase system component IID